MTTEPPPAETVEARARQSVDSPDLMEALKQSIDDYDAARIARGDA